MKKGAALCCALLTFENLLVKYTQIVYNSKYESIEKIERTDIGGSHADIRECVF